MWARWYRYLRPYKYCSIGGQAFPDGFDLSVTIRNAKESCNFSFRADGQYHGLDWPMITAYSALVVLLVTLEIWWVLPPLLFLLFVPRIFLHFGKDWHWCEHQVAHTLELSEYPSREILSATPAASVRCGSMYLWTICLMLLSLSRITYDFLMGAHVFWPSALGVSTLSMVAVLMLRRLWRPWTRTHQIIFVILLTSATPALLIGLMLQRACVLRRPTPEQEDLSLHWSQEAAIIIATEKMKNASRTATP